MTALVTDEVLPANQLRDGLRQGGAADAARSQVRSRHLHGRAPRPRQVPRLEEGDAHVIRNAGGIVTDDALRSLVISHNLLGTEEVLVIGHTDCGMLTFKDNDVQAQLDTDIVLHAFPNLEDRIRESVRTVSESPLLPDAVSGFAYEVETGKLRPVA
jgi:carbonic anhydrase